MNIHFYHLTATPLDRALPKLLEKAYSGGFKTLLLTGSDEQAEWLDQLLWTYDPGSFLPHGTARGTHPEKQPVLVVTAEFLNTYPPGSPASGGVKTLLLVTNGVTLENIDDFERVIDIFDGKDADSVQRARQRWTLYKNAGAALSYLRQTDSGGWEKAA